MPRLKQTNTWVVNDLLYEHQIPISKCFKSFYDIFMPDHVNMQANLE